VRDICAAAGVPQGCFTNHFRSKKAFAEEVLDRYFAGTKELVKQALDDKSPAAAETVSGHHQHRAGARQMESRLPDRPEPSSMPLAFQALGTVNIRRRVRPMNSDEQ
jgi:AcrR family transcriptional regulator